MDGHCDKNYEPVKKHVEKMLQDGIEENLQLCVYVDEKCVVDLYGTAVGDSTYNCDTISVSNAGYNGKLDRIQSYHTILLALITAFCIYKILLSWYHFSVVSHYILKKFPAVHNLEIVMFPLSLKVRECSD